jgi:hypothetical protein
MTTAPRTLTCALPPQPRRRASRPQPQPAAGTPPSPLPTGRVPRVARLMALALRCQQLVQTGVIANYALLAQLGHVSRARVTQILTCACWPPLFRKRSCSCRGPSTAATRFACVTSSR